MSQRDRSLNGSKFGSRSNIGFSGLKSKQLVQSHLKSIMPSLHGGKKDGQIKYIRVRVQETLQAQKNLQTQLKPILDQFCGEHYDYKTFKQPEQILKDEIAENDLYYIFLKEQIASWGQKFSRQQLKQSDGKKSIFIIQFLRKHKYQQKVQQRNKLIQKSRRDPMQKIVYYINTDTNYMQQMQDTVIYDMDIKLKNKLLREGDRVKTWALANKFKQKKAKRQRLYIYIEDILMQKLAGVYKRFQKKNGFKWTQIIKFNSFKDIMENVKHRYEQQKQEGLRNPLKSSMSINPVSKIFDSRSQSAIKTLSFINGNASPSTLSTNKSIKNIVHDKTELGLTNADKNFIIHSYDFQQGDKIYQFVMSQKDNNWQRVIYEDKNYPQLDALVKQIEKNEKQSQKQKDDSQYMQIINAKTLYILTYEGDVQTDQISNSLPNNFNNRYLLGYQSQQQLINILSSYGRDGDNFIIVIIYQQNSSQDAAVKDFMEKNKNANDNQNIIIKYKRWNDLNESLSMNSNLSLNEERDVQRFLRAAMEDRDRHFDPYNCYANNYVYLFYRYDKQSLFDQQLRQVVGQSARLKKTTYQDANYLQNFLKSIERGGDHAIVLTDDSCLRQAQQVVKKFNKASIMNVTDRKRVKDEIKVLAWGPYDSIKAAISRISQKLRVVQRRNYTKVGGEECRQNPIPRRMPKNIQFKQGNNITVKLSTQQTHPDSQVMQDNLNHYFKQQIRIQNYKKPNEIRLVNKVEQPLTFIICRDNQEQLNYMKSIANEQKNDLRQQYILYTENPEKYYNSLFNRQKYERFRFISNSWRKIQEYIIGLYQQLRGIKNDDNEQIYEDELVHLFYDKNNQNLIDYLRNNFQNAKIYNNLRFHDISELQWRALQQSPHHLYYVLVDEIQNSTKNSQQTLNDIIRIQKLLQDKKVAPKKIKMIILNRKPGAMRDQYIQGTFQDGRQAMNYIVNTKIMKPKLQINKPHIIIDRGSQDWYYFLNKHAYKDRYKLYFVDNIPEAMSLIEKVRSAEVGSQFWYIANNQKDLGNFLSAAANVESGMKIYGVYHGELSAGTNPGKIIFASPQRQEIQAFLINSHKRSQTIFSPQSLRKKQPILAMSKQTWNKCPIDQTQIKKWKQDLGADQFYFDNLTDLKSLPADKNIFLIADIEEDRNLKKLSPDMLPPNLWKIIFDSNQRQRKKAHTLIKFYPNSKQAYYGFYPAQIRHYLRYLRYNIKNPPQKLSKKFTKQLMNVYIQKNLSLTSNQLQLLLRNNHSIVNVYSFQNARQSIENAINHGLSNPNYGSLYIFSRDTANIVETMQNKNIINYIIYDPNYRKIGQQVTQSQLLTDENNQYLTYLFNLPQRRYDRAKNYSGKLPMRVMYLQNGKYDNSVKELRQINRRNPNFSINGYKNISDLKQSSQKIVVLVDPVDYNKHLDQLQYRQNITYFILDNDKNRNLYAQPGKSQHFVSKDVNELYGYYNNLRKGIQPAKANRFPTIYLPKMVDNYNKLNFSRPLAFKSNLDLNKLAIFPPFNKKIVKPYIEPVINIPPAPIVDVPKAPPIKIQYQSSNIIDSSLQNKIFLLPSQLYPDSAMINQRLQNYIVRKSGKPLQLNLDFPPGIIEDKFNGRADVNNQIIQKIRKPIPKQVEHKVAILFPGNKQFKQIHRVLQANLQPRSFSQVQPFPYNSDYEFQNLARNLDKFMNFDRTVIFITPKMIRYIDHLNSIKKKSNGKIDYYVFNDNFDQSYNSFKQFLSPYLINNQQLPYINRQDPKFWLTTSIYNVMVPLNKKKRYDSIKRNNIIISPYTSEQDIENQLHRSEQFVIIVCQKKDYNKYKKFPRISPRCILVIDDTSELKQDQIPLYRYPKKVLYYGPDVLGYLSKTRIPNKILPFKPQPMKVLFYNYRNPQQTEFAELDDFDEYEKVGYENSQDLFIKLIQKFKTSSVYKVPPNLQIKDLIKLHPKIYLQKQASFMNRYFNEYSTLDKAHEKQYKRSFKTLIKPQQYSHLPIKQYDNPKQLRHSLEQQQSPCLVYVDDNNREHIRIEKDQHHKHLFIFMFDLSDMWINRSGYLIDSEKLSRQELAVKQALFTTMFNKDVFDTYNDMGYFYLSNTSTFDQVRKIRFMTREQLYELFNKQPNLLMIIFVEHTDRSFIPSQFYDPIRDESKQQRVKLIFIHNVYVHNQNILYVKYNEIDPVIKHINRVQLSSRTNYCLYPANHAGNIIWHKFAHKYKGFKPKQYSGMQEIDSIAQQIKGKFREICVICQRDQQNYFRTIFDHYSIKTKQHTGEKVFFWHISDADNRSFVLPFSNIRNSNINFNQHSEDNSEKFETVGHPIDINSRSNAMSNGPSINHKNLSLQDVIQSKNFVINLNEKLRDAFPVGNLYTNRVKYFKNLSNIDRGTSLNQLVITNQGMNQAKNILQNNPNMFLVFVSDDLPSIKDGNSIVIKQSQIPKFITQLQGIQRVGKVHEEQLLIQPAGSGKNIEDFKIIRIFYDKNLDRELKKQICLAALKNKNLIPHLFQNVADIQDLMKEEGSLSLLLLSKQPANLDQQLQKQNLKVIKHRKRKARLISPKNQNINLMGLQTILQQNQDEFENLDKQSLNTNIDTYLTMLQKNPQKSRNIILEHDYDHTKNMNQSQKEQLLGNQMHPQFSDKLNLHSNINIQANAEASNRELIKQKLDGGVIVLFVDKNMVDKVEEIKKKYNILVQEYSHTINLNNSIRQKKDKFTIVIVDPTMLPQIKSIKQQYPKTVFALWNKDRRQISPADRQNITFQINRFQEFQPLISDIYDENQKIKYNEHGKMQSKLDNKRTSYVDNGNSWRLSTGYNNTKSKNAFVFYNQQRNNNLLKKVQNLTHITFVPYKDFTDLQKKFNTYGGYQGILIANDQDIPSLEQYILKKKQQTYMIKLNAPLDHRENPKIRKNLLLSAISEDQIANFLIEKFGDYGVSDRNLAKPKQGKSYAPRYQPNTFGTTPRFPSQKDYVPYKNDPIYSSRGIKSVSRDSKVLKTDTITRELSPRIASSPYYNR